MSRRGHLVTGLVAAAVMVVAVWLYSSTTTPTSHLSWTGGLYSVVVTASMLVAALAWITMPKE